METRREPATARDRVFQARMLGGCDLRYNGRSLPLTAFTRRRALYLLLLLLLSPGYRLHREIVLEALWPDAEPEAAGRGLRTVLSDLRAACAGSSDDPPPVIRQGETLLFDPAVDLQLDTLRFELAAVDALKDGRLEALRAAVDLYQGPLLPELPYEDWAVGERKRFADLHEQLITTLLAQETTTDPPAAETRLRLLLARDPLHEEHAQSLMRVLAAQDRRVEARRVFEELAGALRDDLGVEPGPDTMTLYQSLLHTRSEGETQRATRHQRVPTPVTRFIGRARELSALQNLLVPRDTAPRLLTLTGAGGSGKTRLVLALAGLVQREFPDGVWFVELAAVQDPRYVVSAVAGSLAIREEAGQPIRDALVEALGERRVLLILDNCEHLLDACAELATYLLEVCPNLQFLATSRERLNANGELAWRVPSLSLPQVSLKTPSAMAANFQDAESVQLFLDRAQRAQPAFRLSDHNAPLIAQICCRLDGIPLALELAAARLSVLALEGIVARLDDRFNLLSGGIRTALPRQQTLRATLAWSWDLLSEGERVLIRRLSVFAGSWPLEATESVCACSDDPLLDPKQIVDVLAGLVHKSLVQFGEDVGASPARYRLLETVREYARERLLEHPAEIPDLVCRLRDWYTANAERAMPELFGPRQYELLEEFNADNENVRALLPWLVEGRAFLGVPPQADPGPAFRFLAAIWRFWDYRGAWSEGRYWLDLALAMPQQHSQKWRVDVLNAAGALAANLGDHRKAEIYWEETLAIKRTLGDQRSLAGALNNLSIAAMVLGQNERAAALLEESLAIKVAENDLRGMPQSLNNLGIVVGHLGQFERAISLHQEAGERWDALGDRLNGAYARLNMAVSLKQTGRLNEAYAMNIENLEVFTHLSERWGMAAVQHNQGNLLLLKGDYSRVPPLYRVAMDLWQQLMDKRGLIECLESTAQLSSLLGRHRQALLLYTAADAWRQRLGCPMPLQDMSMHQTHHDRSRAALDEPDAAAAVKEAAEYTLDRATQIAAEALDLCEIAASS